ncbi:MAG: ABC transporter ATP-binding protein [Desulfosalsimonas sp.]
MGIGVFNIEKSYEGAVALNDVSMEIEDGAFVTLLGATGAGKTTLLRIMAGIDRPDNGRVFYDGKDVTDIPVQKRNISMVYQEFVNYPSMTIYDNIASPLRVSKTRYSKTDIDKQVRYHAELLGLTAVLDHYPEEVSGGQKQRTAIARALIKDTRFIFLDEPLANLDYKLREELRGELKTLLTHKGGAVVYATPESVDALSMSTHVAYFQEGRLLQYGGLEEVYRNPEFVDVGAYFSYPTMNIMEAQTVRNPAGTRLKISEEINIDVTEFADRLGAEKYLVGIRAYNLYTRQTGQNLIPFKATVELAEELGSDTELHVRHGDYLFVVLMQEVTRFPAGEQITVYLDPSRLFIFDRQSRRLVLKTFSDRHG